jgi:tRNA 2-thiouridine synthesizing protein A
MQRTLDARGLLCPMPAVMARAALSSLPADVELVVLATDPEAPIDIAAAAADHGRAARVEHEDREWRVTVGARR